MLDAAEQASYYILAVMTTAGVICVYDWMVMLALTQLTGVNIPHWASSTMKSTDTEWRTSCRPHRSIQGFDGLSIGRHSVALVQKM